MVILRFRPSYRALLIREAVRVLRAGGVIAIPTETVYGLACDPRNTKAVAKIFCMKGRKEKKPLQLIAGTVTHVRRIAVIAGAQKRIAQTYWPGPLTILLLLRRHVRVAARVCPRRMIGVRVTSHALVRDIAKAFGFPLAATSANKSGERPASSGRGVRSAFGTDPQPDLLIDAGALPRRKPTTVARVFSDGRVEVLRQGAVRLS